MENTTGNDAGSVNRFENVAILFVRHSVQLVTQAQRQGQIAADFPSVLGEPVILVLPEKLVVGGLADLILVEELRLLVLNHKTPQRERSVLNRLCIAREILVRPKSLAKLEYRVGGHLTAAVEIVGSTLADIAEISRQT